MRSNLILLTEMAIRPSGALVIDCATISKRGKIGQIRSIKGVQNLGVGLASHFSAGFCDVRFLCGEIGFFDRILCYRTGHHYWSGQILKPVIVKINSDISAAHSLRHSCDWPIKVSNCIWKHSAPRYLLSIPCHREVCFCAQNTVVIGDRPLLTIFMQSFHGQTFQLCDRMDTVPIQF